MQVFIIIAVPQKKTTIKTETCCICLTYVLDGFNWSYD